MADEQMPVKIRVKTDVAHEGEKETFELSLFGRLFKKDGSTFLKYDEVQDEGVVHTIVKLADAGALILRSGALKMRMIFEEGQRLNGSYESQFGTLLLTTDTKIFTHNMNDAGTGQAELVYSLLMQGDAVGTYTMNIHYELEEQL
ncbi:DUF1934 domain-containing protein [Domibacillus sp. DTU_2020_1001157_1_SI_ALB_TIR_016]|uniref:DUF1934 domain-containing protein n=1 Tax=Domibacillus sp. DTU_2020_1001157_1_SI_ALB_TIR_016 TaxID=3077789 RepID=UPI0028E7AF99|nr:DUF1934 domain-containing protein [Domibacillus sp. DTU_2020_1001157_1_SI_ALB_TIR_016]WNS81088.1 DUF1934 domain-containing protein [Domibacillus sp. DTU_2020_1001157_1_SI_ALB_TIR_016]